MKLIPLMDRTGATRAWADRQTGWISDLKGKAWALVAFDGVFSRTGIQVGWWHGDYITDRFGRIVLAQIRARIDGVAMPMPRKIPRPPMLHLPSARPALQWLLIPPLNAHRWVDFESFHASGLTRTGVEKLRNFADRLGRQIAPSAIPSLQPKPTSTIPVGGEGDMAQKWRSVVRDPTLPI